MSLAWLRTRTERCVRTDGSKLTLSVLANFFFWMKKNILKIVVRSGQMKQKVPQLMWHASLYFPAHFLD